jgi:hypothetical protein
MGKIFFCATQRLDQETMFKIVFIITAKLIDFTTNNKISPKIGQIFLNRGANVALCFLEHPILLVRQSTFCYSAFPGRITVP